MRMFSKAAILCMSLFTVVASCKKDDNITTATTSSTSSQLPNVIVHNNTNKTINFVWKDTVSFGKLQKHSGHLRIPPFETVKIPNDSFQYYRVLYEYYSDDKYITNVKELLWIGLKAPLIIPDSDTSDFIISIADSPSVLYVKCVKADGSGTKWRTTDAFNASGVSVWSGLSLNEQNQSLSIDTFSNWWGLLFTYKGYMNGRNIEVQSGADKAGANAFNLSCKYAKKASYTIMDDCRPAAPLYTTSLDTMYMKVDSIPYYYKMYRVK